jgi:hypothetical protein
MGIAGTTCNHAGTTGTNYRYRVFASNANPTPTQSGNVLGATAGSNCTCDDVETIGMGNMRTQFFRDHNVTYQGTEDVNGTNTTLTAVLRVNPNGTPCNIDLTISPAPQGIPCNMGTLQNGVVNGTGFNPGDMCNFTSQTFNPTGGLCDLPIVPNATVNSGTVMTTGKSLSSTSFDITIPIIPGFTTMPTNLVLPAFGIDCVSVAIGTAN